MSETVSVVSGIKIRRVAAFDVQELYDMMKDWLEFNSYPNVKENEYIERATTGGGKNTEIYWEVKKKITDYVENRIKITFFIINHVKVEIQKSGRKIKVDKGDMFITFDADMVLDPDDKYEKNPFTGLMQKFYNEVLNKSQQDYYALDLYEKTYRLQNVVKDFLEMHSY